MKSFLSSAGDWREHILLPASIFHWWKAYFVAREYFLLVESIFCCPRVFFVGGKHILLPKSRNFFIRLARGEQGHVTED